MKVKHEEGGTEYVLKMFPSVFTAMAVMLFMIPAFTLFYIAKQPAVDYFIHDYTQVVFVIPVIIFLVHQFHIHNGPNKFVTALLGMTLPAVILFVLSSITVEGSKSIIQSLFSIDCDMLPQKVHLQREWEAAESWFNTCIAQTALKSHFNFTLKYIATEFRMQDCGGYEAIYDKHEKEWSYLRRLEENYMCTGFCVPSRQLWSKGPHKDSCSVAVSQIFKYFVSARSEKVQTIMMMIFLPTLVFFAVLQPALVKLGYDFKW